MDNGPRNVNERERRVRFWLVVACCWMVWGGLYAIQLHRVKEGASVPEVLRYAFSDTILWALATPLVWWLARRFPVRRSRALVPLLTHLVLAPIVVTAVLLLDAFQDQFTRSSADEGWSFESFVIHAFSYRINSNLLIYASLVAIGHFLEHQRGLRESERRVGELRALLAEARLRTIRSQLQPHFLFNCLNTISGLVETRPKDARRMIELLADLLRMALNAPAGETIPLCDEIRFVETYLSLEKSRFGERLRVEVDVPPACADVAVPAILLQPLVENAVRHGISSKEGGCVGVRARIDGERLELRVDDDGVGPGDAEDRQGIGLSSVRARLQEFFGEEHSFRVSPRAGGGTEIVISIPVTRAPAPAGG